MQKAKKEGGQTKLSQLGSHQEGALRYPHHILVKLVRLTERHRLKISVTLTFAQKQTATKDTVVG